MKYVLILILALGLFSCNDAAVDDMGKAAQAGIQVLVVNGCQYVVYKASNYNEAGVSIVHAGNCNNSH